MPPAPARCPVDTPALVLMYKLIAPLAERAAASARSAHARSALRETDVIITNNVIGEFAFPTVRCVGMAVDGISKSN